MYGPVLANYVWHSLTLVQVSNTLQHMTYRKGFTTIYASPFGSTLYHTGNVDVPVVLLLVFIGMYSTFQMF